MPKHLLLEPVVNAERAGGTPALAANPWSPVIAVAGQKQALLYHTETLELLGVLPFERGFIESLTFSRNGQLLIAGGGRGGKTGGMVAWDVQSGSQRMSLGSEYDAVLAADMMADMTTVALGGPGKRVKMFELPTGEPLFNIKKHSDWVMALAFSPDTVLLASGDRNGGLHIWESFTGNLFYSLDGHRDDITQLTWRFDSNVIASPSEDGSVRLWEMFNGKQGKSWTAHGGGTLSVQFSHSGDLVTAGRDRQVKIWDQNGKQKRAINGFKSLPLEAVFSNDGKRVFVGEWNGSVTAWDAANGKPLGELSANPPALAKRLEAVERPYVSDGTGVACEHHGLTPGQRPADRLVSPAPHRQHVAHRRHLEPLEILRQMPRDRFAAPDHPVERHRGDGLEGMGGHRSDRDRRLDRRMRIVVPQLEVLETESMNVLHLRVDYHRRKRPWLALQLQLGLVEVVRVQV